MRSLHVLSKLGYLGAAYLWDYIHLGKRNEARAGRFATRLRDILLELGGVYVKLGQLLSTRPDVIEPVVSRELEVLLDRCPAEPLEATLETMREELGVAAQAELPFDVLGEMASASFGCVYRLRLRSGRIVAMKVLRRGIELQAKKDLRFLMRLARALDFLAVTHRYRMADWIEELVRWTAEELNYQLEARKMTHIAKSIRRVGGVKIPEVMWPLTTRRLLAMEHLEGRWLSKGIETLSHAERAHAATLLFQVFLFQIFELGFFHADLHKGNVCLLPDGRVGMIDFGITGFASPRTRQLHLNLIAAFQKGDVDEAFASILEFSFVSPDADLASFKRHFEHEYYDWFLRTVEPDIPSYEKGPGSLMLAIFRRAYECAIVVDSEVVRYYRAFSIVDGSVNSLDPEFSLTYQVDRYLKSRLRRQIEDRVGDAFDPIGSLVAVTTALAFRTSEVRQLLYGASKSVDSAMARALLVIAGLKRALARAAWVVVALAMALRLLVALDVLSLDTPLIKSHRLGKIEVGDIVAVGLPLFALAVLLGWLGRLVRARVYSNSQTEAGTSRGARGGRR
jgi:predicted unusual protein kinase regulating ubiquinone biosynthesis (AarF/ABC1/UbiB family)